MPTTRARPLHLHSRSVPFEGDPGLALFRARDLPAPFLMDGGLETSSVLAVGGALVARFPGDSDPFQAVREHLLDWSVAPEPNAGFMGGLMGWFGYDVRVLLEELPDRHPREGALPDLNLAAYRVWAHLDPGASRAEVRWLEDADDLVASREARSLAGLLATSLEAPGEDPPPPPPPFPGHAVIAPDRNRHVRAVEEVRRLIGRGDVYQVNLAQRWEAPRPRDLIGFYRRLRMVNPAAFGAFAGAAGEYLLSVSPERFLRVDGDRVETRPIKGTAPRHEDPESDRVSARDLQQSSKDRAELSMIVDVMRNDLSRVCRPGSVEVRGGHVLESHPTVHHLVATVVGRLAADRDRVDLLRATLPGGSVTGAPRIRAMEVIDELELARRGVYCGSLGFMGYDGRMDLNILIRTAFTADERLIVSGGGGVVWDSDAVLEDAETEQKLRGILTALHGGDGHG